MDVHKDYKLVWEKLEFDSYFGGLEERRKELESQVIVSPFLYAILRSVILLKGVQDVLNTAPAQLRKTKSKLEKPILIRSKDEEINNTLYDVWRLYIEDPKNQDIITKIEQLKKEIGDNARDISLLIFENRLELIKSLIDKGRRRLAKMKDVEEKLDKISSAEILWDENEFHEKVKRIIDEHEKFNLMEKEAELIIKDAKYPAVTNFLLIVLTIIIIILTATLFLKEKITLNL